MNKVNALDLQFSILDFYIGDELFVIYEDGDIEFPERVKYWDLEEMEHLVEVAREFVDRRKLMRSKSG